MNEESSILHPLVLQGITAAGLRYQTLACEPDASDTADFCARYGYPADEVCNTILVVVKKSPREYVACLVRSDTKLDVNHSVAAEIGFKRLSFASAEETAALSGMLIGGVTLIGLPETMPILIDEHVFEKSAVIVGGGNRSSKVRLDPNELLKLPGARRARIASKR